MSSEQQIVSLVCTYLNKCCLVSQDVTTNKLRDGLYSIESKASNIPIKQYLVKLPFSFTQIELGVDKDICNIYLFDNTKTMNNIINYDKLNLVNLAYNNVLLVDVPGIICFINMRTIPSYYYIDKSTQAEDEIKAVQICRTTQGERLGGFTHHLIETKDDHVIDESNTTVVTGTGDKLLSAFGVSYVFVVYRSFKLYKRLVERTSYVIKEGNYLQVIRLRHE